MNNILELKNISIRFFGNQILDQVCLSIRQPEIHFFIGEKESGKSTLVKIMSGLYPHGTYTGDIFIDGKPVNFTKVRDSEKSGIFILYQNAKLIEQMTVCENMFLGDEISRKGIIDWPKTYEECTKALQEVGLDAQPITKVYDIPRRKQYLIKIARAFCRNTRILIMDESFNLGDEENPETSFLVNILEKLRQKNITCFFVAHHFNKVMDIADRITVIRDGKIVLSNERKNTSREVILHSMLGKDDSLTSEPITTQFISYFNITEREKEIIEKLLDGYNAKAISDQLFISLNTVKTHIYKIYQKTSVNNRMALARLIKNGK